MGFVATPQQAARFRDRESFDYYDAEILSIVWETSPEIVKRLLPPPLKPAKRPLATAFVATYPRTNFSLSYREAALTLQTEFGGVAGAYYVAMNVTDDMALIGGREMMGFPKKLADIAFYREGQASGGWAERHGVRYVAAKAQLTGAFNTADASEAFMEVFGAPGEPAPSIAYNFKSFLSADWKGLEYPPRLVRQETTMRTQALEIGEATLELKPSDFDPWSEVKVVRLLGAMYWKGDFAMRRGQVVAEVDPETFMPYAYAKRDPLE